MALFVRPLAPGPHHKICDEDLITIYARAYIVPLLHRVVTHNDFTN